MSYFAGGILANVALDWPDNKALLQKSLTKEEVLRKMVRPFKFRNWKLSMFGMEFDNQK